MKKIYIEPSVKAVEIKLPAILAVSGEEKLEEPQNPSQALSLDADFDEFEVEE